MAGVDFVSLAFAFFNLVRVAAYLPQIVAVARDALAEPAGRPPRS